jgi:hypothetical protein
MSSAAPPARPFEAVAPDAAQTLDDRWVGHLLRRAGFGATHELLDRFAGRDPAAALDWLLDDDPDNDPLGATIESLAGSAFTSGATPPLGVGRGRHAQSQPA